MTGNLKKNLKKNLRFTIYDLRGAGFKEPAFVWGTLRLRYEVRREVYGL